MSNEISLIIAGVAAACLLTLFLLWRRARRRSAIDVTESRTHKDPVETEFANVFFNLVNKDKERIIAHWMNRSNCDRAQAMRLAIDDWRKDQRSWR